MNKELLLALLSALAVGGCADNKTAPEKNLRVLLADLGVLAVGEYDGRELTVEQIINALLDDLANKPTPKELNPGAMCYFTGGYTRNCLELNCPSCGSKTLCTYWAHPPYETDDFLKNPMESLVNEIRKLGLDAKLDEQSLCESCRAKTNPVPEEWGVCLMVTLNGKTTRTRLDTQYTKGYSDLVKLKAFLEGKQAWDSGESGEKLLQPELPRIRQLLGLE